MSPAKMAPALTEEQMPLEEQIRIRAHEIYLERGDRPGSDVDDWLQAEREILGPENNPLTAKKR